MAMTQLSETHPTTPDAPLVNEISQFLYHEARLLDENRFVQWLALVTPDISYRMPLRINREKKDGSDEVDEMSFFEENHTTLSSRVARLGTRSAWAEDPPSRVRHFITNVLVETGADEHEYTVTSNLLFTRNRGSAEHSDILAGVRNDVLRRVDGLLLLASRVVHLDHAVLGTLNLSTIY
jgi:3-phenylpropionate/cinnamic acid dioxygenase small subunit